MKRHKSDIRRRGTTAVELLVVTAVISVAIALLLPAILHARSAAHAVECRSHLSQVALAVLNWHDSHGRFPPATTVQGPAANYLIQRRNWVVDVLPWIDQQVIADRWDHDAAVTSVHNQQLAETHLAVLTCPADISLNGGGDLSFAVPSGLGTLMATFAGRGAVYDAFRLAIDLNGDGHFLSRDGPSVEAPPTDADVFRMTALFGHENNTPDWGDPGRPARHHTLHTVTDGTSHTLLLAENCRTGFDPGARFSNWATTDPQRVHVFIGPAVCRDNHCRHGNVDLKLANTGSQAINSGRDQPEGRAPWPNSFHDGGVNVALCDGSVRFLSENTDGRVCFALYTPQGGRLSPLPLAED